MIDSPSIDFEDKIRAYGPRQGYFYYVPLKPQVHSEQWAVFPQASNPEENS